MQGTTHIFRLSAPEKGSKGQPPHLAAASIPFSERSLSKPQRLQPAGRARPSGILNGSIPGSAAASAAVNLYNGTSGRPLPHLPSMNQHVSCEQTLHLDT